MAGSSNFQQWNPGSVNQENDSAYTGDAQRAGGAPINSRFPSATANKLFYQVSIMCAAIGQFISAAGFVASDTSLTALVVALTKAIKSLIGINNINTVTWSATPSFDLSLGTVQQITLLGNSVPVFINTQIGGQYIFIIKQNSAGGNTFPWPAGWPGAAIGLAANQVSVQSFIVEANGTPYPLTPMTLS